MNNPPAFPAFDREGRASDVERGMTLRDYFAAAAMQGLNANPSCRDSNDQIAIAAFAAADAMLKVREQ